VDAMLERATTVTQEGAYTRVDYARYADDLVILVDWHRRHDWLLRAVHRRLREELAKLDLRLNEDKSRTVDLRQGDLRIPGLRLSARPLVTGRLEGASNAEDHTADGVADKAQGSVPPVSVTTGGAADRGDQPDPAGVGELLPDREREPVPGLCEAVGRAESTAPFNEGEGPSRLRLEEVEYGVVP